MDASVGAGSSDPMTGRGELMFPPGAMVTSHL